MCIRDRGIGGGTTNIQPALLKGDFDLYPEYTGTAWLTVLKHEKEDDPDVLYENLQKEYQEMGLHWSGLYGFQNSYVLAVRKEAAEEYGLKTFSDLAAASGNLIFGGNPDYCLLYTSKKKGALYGLRGRTDGRRTFGKGNAGGQGAGKGNAAGDWRYVGQR